MLQNALKHAWLVIVVAALAACDGSALTGPEENDVSPPPPTDCRAGVVYSLDARCAAEVGELQEPTAPDREDGEDKPRRPKGGKDKTPILPVV